MAKAIVKYLLTVLCLCCLAGCTDPGTAMRALRGAHYRDIRITGYAPNACRAEMLYATGFVGTDQNGNTTSGTVCQYNDRVEIIAFEVASK